MGRPSLWRGPHGNAIVVARAKFRNFSGLCAITVRTSAERLLNRPFRYAAHARCIGSEGRDLRALRFLSAPSLSRHRHVREMHGDAVIWFSPDEVATIVALDARAKKIVAVKAVFPGAEIVNCNRTDRAIDFPLGGKGRRKPRDSFGKCRSDSVVGPALI
jgi:hypothetical protein